MKDVNLRIELDKMIDSYGLKALYIRENKFARCRCYNQLHRSGDPNCRICSGFGHLTAIETARFIYDNNYFRDGESENKALGVTSNESVILYMSNKTRPKTKDRIYITNWIGPIPEEISRVYIITSVDEMRMDNGRVEGYTVTAKQRTDLLRSANDTLNSLDRKAKAELGKGGRHIWPYNSTQS